MSKQWTREELARAQEMRDQGMTSFQVAPFFGVSAGALRAILSPSHANRSRAKREPYLSSFFAGPPIARCREQERLHGDAIIGSQQLAAAIVAAGLRP